MVAVVGFFVVVVGRRVVVGAIVGVSVTVVVCVADTVVVVVVSVAVKLVVVVVVAAMVVVSVEGVSPPVPQAHNKSANTNSQVNNKYFLIVSPYSSNSNSSSGQESSGIP